MKICFAGPLLDFSGFAHAARGMLRGLVHAGADIVARSISYDSGGNYEPEKWMLPLLEESLDNVDIFIQSTTCNIEANPKPGICNGLYTFLELDRIPVQWSQKANEFDFILVSSVSNAETLVRCGCTKPILVIPIGFDMNTYKNVTPLEIKGSEDRTLFYNICQLSPKKGIDLLLRSYYAAFADKPDEVLLILKIYVGMQNRDGEREKIIQYINSVKEKCNLPLDKYPPVKVITDVGDENDIQALHAACDVYVNSSRAEGFCIPAFEAMAHANVLISSAVGGMAEYVDTDSALVFNTVSSCVFDVSGHDPYLYNGIAQWHEPSTAEMAAIMRSYHLLKKGVQSDTLSDDNYKKWVHVQSCRSMAANKVKKFSFEIVGPKLYEQLQAGYNKWSESRQMEFVDHGQ